MSKSNFFKRGALLLALQAAFAVQAAGTSGLERPHFDTSVRIQDDLYMAVNGGWVKNTEIPADKGTYGAFIQLRDLSDQRVRGLLDELVAKPQAEGSKEQKIARVYQAFLDTDRIDAAGLAPVQPLLAEIDAIGNARELAAWFGRVQGIVRTPIQLNVGADARQPDMNRAYAGQGGLGLPGRDYYIKRDDARMAKAREAYVVYLTELARAAGEADPAAAAQRVMALETKLAEAHWDPVLLRDPVKGYNPMKPAELAKRAPGLDWQTMLDAASLGKVDRVIVAQPSTAVAVGKMVRTLPLADWKLYAKLQTLDAHAPVLPKTLRDARFALRGQALSGMSSERARWQLGVDQVNAALGESLGQLYVERYFPAAHKAKMEQLVGNLMGAFGDSIDGLSWMSAQTKKAARYKLGKIAVKIGYPDVWRDFSALEVREGDALGNKLRSQRFEWQVQAAKAGQKVDRREWGMLPQTVNAYYDPTNNEIVFPAAILQPPFFDAEADDAVNYGGIGGVIGHEISHGFDDEGSQFDGDGKLRNWWSKADRKAFDELTAKLVAQYDAYEAIPGKHVNGRLTLGENIADLSGLQVAYKAYQRSLKGQAAPVLDGFSGAQRFFIGWSQVWRNKQREQTTLQRLTMDPHSPSEFRANGSAVNSDAFHEAFGTKEGDKMFKPAGERIRLW